MKELNLEKRIHNISARFFGVGTDGVDDPLIKGYIEKIHKTYMKYFDGRLKKLEDKVFKKAHHFSADGTEVSANYKHVCNPKCN